jgi:hypothetical protein
MICANSIDFRDNIWYSFAWEIPYPRKAAATLPLFPFMPQKFADRPRADSALSMTSVPSVLKAACAAPQSPRKEPDRSEPAPNLPCFSAPLITFRMNTSKTVTKQRILSVFRINVYAKPGGRVRLWLTAHLSSTDLRLSSPAMAVVAPSAICQ